MLVADLGPFSSSFDSDHGSNVDSFYLWMFGIALAMPRLGANVLCSNPRGDRIFKVFIHSTCSSTSNSTQVERHMIKLPVIFSLVEINIEFNVSCRNTQTPNSGF